MNKPTTELTLRELIERNRLETQISPASTAALDTAVFNPVTRRGFLAGLSAGSLLLMCRVGLGKTAEVADPAKVNADAFAPDLWVSIAPDGTVTVLAHRSEMGTGIRTGLPRVLADELEADWSRVVIRQAQGDKRLGDQNTDGSNSIRFFFDTMRTAGATARTMLERAAAQQWKVDPSECYAELHQVKHKGTGKALGFGELVAVARKLEIPGKRSVKLKPRDKWRYIGKDAPITDLKKIVTGRAVYGIDARLDNQLFAVAARPPVVGGKIKSLDDSAAKAVAGVVAVIKLPGFKGAPVFQPLGGVAVCATSTWAAIQGREALKIEWEDGENASYDTAQFAKSLKDSVNRAGTALRSAGDAARAIAGAKKVIKADYSVPHLAHASMEPTCAVADVQTDAHGKVIKCYLRAATQNPQAVQQSVGPALGIPNDQVECDVTLLGSGFGRKSKPDYCVEAALLSRELKRPVHMTWTREDDVQHDYYHAISAIHCEAAVGDNGRPVAWLQRVAYPSIGSTFSKGADRPAAFEAEMGHTDLPYDVPNLSLEVCRAKAHTRIGWLRSVCHIQQNFAVGSFVDELAHAAGRDPLEYLLDALGDDRMIDLAAAKLSNRGAKPKDYPYDVGRLKNVMRRAAKNADWPRHRSLPKGRGLGIACCRSFNSYTGHVVEVTVGRDGKLSIDRVWCSIDAGTIVLPDRVSAQVEGAAIFACSQAVFGELSFKQGRSVQTNFDSFHVAKMSEAPKEIFVDIVPSEAPPAGVGEPGVPSTAPALCNAIFAATGKRIRDLPLKNHNLSWS
ncbi:MAG TPA: molybdopterin cofactor-binding domain-containing protein [Planctomycetaceae bacterium]|nr:molybdopterin cofactor-binding domain-containing protein [Planctomycetaceae bacterium]